MHDRAVLLFSKPSIAGRVKTRLIGALTALEAADLHAAFLADLVARLGEFPADLVVCWALQDDEPVPAVPAGGRRQRGAGLGERMIEAFRGVAATHRCAAALGSDHPDLPLDRLHEAFESLERGADLAVGPAHDGGYYLIAGRPGEIPSEMFRDIPWSSPRVFTETVRRAADLGLVVQELAPGEDVDTVEDLRRLAIRLGGARVDLCPRTRAALAALGMTTEAACAS